MQNTLKHLFKLSFVVVLLLFNTVLQAQELQCSASVVTPSIQGTNREVYQNMQESINEFINGHKWTDNVFASQERIECTILININQVVSANEYSGTFQIQSRRPVYGTNYKTMMLNYIDEDFKFEYTEFQQMIDNPNTYDGNLIEVISYYINIVLGFDYDSFSPNGGSQFIANAEKIVNQAQNAPEAGWKSYESRRNRYWLVENYLNEFHKPLRDCMYRYHRLGLDMLADNPTDARSNILTALENMRSVQREKPGSFAMQIFFDAKSDEIVNIFSESFAIEKQRILEIMLEIDPSNSEKYNEGFSGESD